jgi:hypothetical protein
MSNKQNDIIIDNLLDLEAEKEQQELEKQIEDDARNRDENGDTFLESQDGQALRSLMGL